MVDLESENIKQFVATMDHDSGTTIWKEKFKNYF